MSAEFWLKELKESKQDMDYAYSKNSYYLKAKAESRYKYVREIVRINGYD